MAIGVRRRPRLDVINPATGKAFMPWRVPIKRKWNKDCCAKTAFPTWAKTPIAERRAALNKIADVSATRLDEFARLSTQESASRCHSLCAKERRIGVVARIAQLDIQEQVLKENEHGRIVQKHAPLGVIAAITAWNFPMTLLMNKMPPALLAGNTIVIKPAPTTPLTTLLFGALCNDFLPPGVMNVIVDQNDLGGLLTQHPDIAKVAFTGSTATGKKVMASAATGVKRVTLELGGNDPAIVLPIPISRHSLQKS